MCRLGLSLDDLGGIEGVGVCVCVSVFGWLGACLAPPHTHTHTTAVITKELWSRVTKFELESLSFGGFVLALSLSLSLSPSLSLSLSPSPSPSPPPPSLLC